MAGPLDGIRVLELAEGIGGPMAAWFLAELGAEVCKIEPPHGDRLRRGGAALGGRSGGAALEGRSGGAALEGRSRPNFHVLNRGKQSVVLDPRVSAGGAPSDRKRLDTLLRGADALIVDETSRRAWDLDLGTLSDAHPGLVVVHAPLYGSAGPFAGLPEDDDLLGALSGLFSSQLSYRDGPIYLTVPTATCAQAILAAQATLAALLQRLRNDGAGVRPAPAEVSGVRAAYAFQAGAYMSAPQVPARSASERRFSPRRVLPCYGYFQAQDDLWFFIGVLSPAQWIRLATCLGLEDFLADPAFADGPMGATDQAALDRLLVHIETLLRTRPRSHWLRVLADGDVAHAPIATREDYVQEEQVRHMRMVVDVDDAELGPTKQMGTLLRFDGLEDALPTGAPPLDPAAPLPDWPPRPLSGPFVPSGVGGETNGREPVRPERAVRESKETNGCPQTRSSRAKPGPSEAEGHSRRVEGARTDPPAQATALPLEGIVVIDLGTFIAGAYASTLLSDLGAEILKVEPPDGDPWRQWGLGFFGWNRGKRSLTLNLREAAGHAALLRLVARADAVIDNYRPAVARRLNVTDDALRAANPALINVTVTSNGPDGALAERPAFDQVFQARSGASLIQGGGPDGEPVIHSVAINDHMTASVAALGTIAGLLARARGMPGPNGLPGHRGRTSLLQNAMIVTAGEFITYDGRPQIEFLPREPYGLRALRRAYQCADGWLFLATTTSAHWSALCAVLGAADLASQQGPDAALAAPCDGDLAAAIATRFASLDRDDAIARLNDAGIPCVPCPELDEILAGETALANGAMAVVDTVRFGPVAHCSRFARFGDADPPPLPAPELGQHSRVILGENGFTAAEIDALFAAGVTSEPPTDPP